MSPFSPFVESVREARDLRRGMYSEDVPALCQSCRYHDLVEPYFILPFVESEEASFAERFQIGSKQSNATIEIIEPVHGLRANEPTEFKLRKPNVPIKHYVFAVGLGGESDDVQRETIRPTEYDRELAFVLPETIWSQLKPNVGYWWMVWAIPVDAKQKPLRCQETRCLIRHQPISRLAGSTLRHRDQGFVPVSDLGGNKRAGWQDPNHLPARLVAAFHGRESATKREPIATRSTIENTTPEKRKSLLKRWFATTNDSGIKNAYLEVISQQTNSLKISGWIVLKNGAPAEVVVIGKHNKTILANVVKRDDIAVAYPILDSAINAGFEAMLPDEDFWVDDSYRFKIIARQNGQVVFQCQVNCRGGHEGAGETHCIRNGVLEV